MKTAVSPPVPFNGAVAVCALCLAPVILLASVRPAPGADLRKAVRKVLPATVAVEWRASDHDDPSPKESAETLDRESLKRSMTAYALLSLAPAQKPDAVVLASGTAVSPDGLIVTATGETADGSYSVTFQDGSTLPARLLVLDRRSGLQLLKVDSVKLAPLELADKEAEPGQQVVAVLCTDPKSRSVAQGIVAAQDRRVSGLPCELIQTDVRVGKMSAGAPLADVNGRLLGIVAAINAPSANKQGSAFAVPVEYVRLILEAREGIEPVAMDRPMLGIRMDSPTEGDSPVVRMDRPMLGIRIDSPTEGDSPVVRGVAPDTPAAGAGIREGDEIARIEGQEVSTVEDVLRRLGRLKPGDRITVTIRRDGKQEELEATLDRFQPPPKTTARRQPKIEAVLPQHLLLLDDTKRLEAAEAYKEAMKIHNLDRIYKDAFKAYEEQLRARGHPSPAPATIRVQRSDVQKTLDQLGRDVQSLREQITALTEEVKKLGKQLQNKPTADQ